MTRCYSVITEKLLIKHKKHFILAIMPISVVPFSWFNYTIRCNGHEVFYNYCDSVPPLLGRHLADLPLSPQLGKMILYSVVLKCVDPVVTIACALAYRDPCK